MDKALDPDDASDGRAERVYIWTWRAVNLVWAGCMFWLLMPESMQLVVAGNAKRLWAQVRAPHHAEVALRHAESRVVFEAMEAVDFGRPLGYA